MIIQTERLSVTNRDGFKRPVTIGVIAGNLKEYGPQGQTYFCCIYDLKETMRQGHNTVNGVEEHVPQTFQHLIEQGIFPKNTRPQQVLFFHLSDPLLEGICQTDVITLDWHHLRGTWTCSTSKEWATWKYVKPDRFLEITGMRPDLLVDLLC